LGTTFKVFLFCKF